VLFIYNFSLKTLLCFERKLNFWAWRRFWARFRIFLPQIGGSRTTKVLPKKRIESLKWKMGGF